MRVFEGDQVLRSPSVPPSILTSCRGAASANLGVHVVLFLREQVRDLQVQEFLRELVVGGAAPSDLAESIIVEILHCSEGGNVEQVARILKQIFRLCDCLSLSLSLSLSLTCV